ncbi:MAG: NUDIX hydrolase [Patescibacteria group bacterium]
MISCTFENGNKAFLRHVVVDTLVLKDDKILLVKRAERLLEGGKWALVGGYVDQGETLPQAVQREVFEETGYRIHTIQMLAVNADPHRPNEDRQNISFIFVAEAGEKEGESDDEVSEQKWYGFDDLPPEATIAFDHYQAIELYLEYKKNPQPLPIIVYER